LFKLNLALFGLLLLFFNFNLEACSRIFWNNQFNKIAARTMDLAVDEKPTLAIVPRGLLREGNGGDHSIEWSSKYGSVVVTAFDGQAISEGMNEKGLSAHVLCLEGTEYEPLDTRPSLSNALWVQYMLDNFSSVQDVLNSLPSFRVVSSEIGGRHWPLHACLEDRFGDSAVIEFVNGKMGVHHGSKYRVMTNEPSYDFQIQNLQRYQDFGGELPLSDGFDSESRFVRCATYLKKLPEPRTLQESIDNIFGVISTVQVPSGDTRWISVVDLTHLTYYFHSTSASNFFKIDFKNLDFSSKQPIRHINPHDPSLIGEISGLFWHNHHLFFWNRLNRFST
jgi:penicillin V acylase-like amidase (Ntn superfamily)